MKMIMIKEIKDTAKSQCILVYLKISVDNMRGVAQLIKF
jgi:hypothetical protein